MQILIPSSPSVKVCVRVSCRWGCKVPRPTLRFQRFWAKPVRLGWSAWFSGVAGLTYAVWRSSIGDGQSLVLESNVTGSSPISPGAVGSRNRATGLTSARHGNVRVPASRASLLMQAKTPLHPVKPDPRKGRSGALQQCQPVQLRSAFPERGGVGMPFSILTANRRQGIRYACNRGFHRIGSAKEFVPQIVCCGNDYVGTLWSLPHVQGSPTNSPNAGQSPRQGGRYACSCLLGENHLHVRTGLRLRGYPHGARSTESPHRLLSNHEEDA